MSAPSNRHPAGTPTGGQFAPTALPEADTTLDTASGPTAGPLAAVRQRAEALRAAIAHKQGIREATVTEDGYVRAQVRLDRVIARDADMREVLDSGRVSDTPDAPVLLCVEERTDPMLGTRFELSDGHHRIAAKIRNGECWVSAVIDPSPDDEPLDGEHYDFIPTREMPAAEFCTRFGTDLYSGDWPTMLDDEQWQEGGDEGADIDWLADSLQDNGMTVPADIEDGKVVDGCHRVALALHFGLTVRYREWTRDPADGCDIDSPTGD